MKLKILSISTLLLVSGCSTLKSWTGFEEEQSDAQLDSTEQVEQARTEEVMVAQQQEQEQLESADPNLEPASASVRFQQNYRDQLLNKMGQLARRKPNKAMSSKNINYYVRGLMHELVGNMQYVNASTPVAVTSFVFLDSNYEQADLIGKQIAESFIHEVHKFGIPVLDFKTTDYVRVSPHGDFIMSKDYLELSGELPIKYALAGTMVKHLSGYMVNARIIGVESKAVVASAQGFLPANVINSLISSNLNDGIPVTSGE